MAWRPTRFLIEGELDNTNPGKVTGWMRFNGLKETVRFELEGDFHRDIRGAAIRLSGGDCEEADKAPSFMYGFSLRQTGKVGDITAGLPPQDYVDYPYIEWYSQDNGRVVLELDASQITVVGRPIPAMESDPMSRQAQACNMAEFLAGMSAELGVPAVAVGAGAPLVSDPAFTHWVVLDTQIIGEAHSVEPDEAGQSFAFVRLFAMPEMAEFGNIESDRLRAKAGAPA